MSKLEKLGAIQNVEAFEQAAAQVNSPEEMLELLKKHGVELTMDELQEMAEEISNNSSDDLSAEDLDNVAGGAAFWGVKIAIKILKNYPWGCPGIRPRIPKWR